MMAPAKAAEVEALLAEMPAWGSEFTGTFANHAPMVLCALAEIGGTPAQMRRFFDHYKGIKKLLPFGQPSTQLDATTWRSVLGQREREPDLRLFFSAEVSRLGIEAALKHYLPDLAPGVAASAFHALMRTAYGVLRQNQGDIAIALAYWAATYLALPPATGASPVTDDPAEILRRVTLIAPMHTLPLHDLLWQNMRDAAALPDFVPVVDWLEIGPDTMEKMAAVAIRLFAATQHFAALHVVTGLHWIRLLTPTCDRQTRDTMLRVFWQAIAALMRELDFPTLPPEKEISRWRALAAPDWPVIFAAAASSYDEHDISLAYSAAQEMTIYADPLYRVAAARRLGLIGDYRI
ncbi:questin oxidase family protein [Agrobacterium vitis]